MTREQRIEAAARAMLLAISGGKGSQFDDLPKHMQADYVKFADAAVTAAFPELMSDPPTGWVAPTELTEAMGHEMFMHSDDVWTMWAAARDAYTKEQT